MLWRKKKKSPVTKEEIQDILDRNMEVQDLRRILNDHPDLIEDRLVHVCVFKKNKCVQIGGFDKVFVDDGCLIFEIRLR